MQFTTQIQSMNTSKQKQNKANKKNYHRNSQENMEKWLEGFTTRTIWQSTKRTRDAYIDKADCKLVTGGVQN